MSAPVHRDDETDDFRFYAPKWVREPPASPATRPTSPSSDAPESIVSRPTNPSDAKARAEGHEQPVATARSQAAPRPRMPPGVGGLNIPLQPTPPAQPPAARVKSSVELAPGQGYQDEWPPALRRRGMPLDPEFVSAPPRRARKGAVLRWLTGLTVAAGIGALAALGIAWMTQPIPRQMALKDDRSVSPLVAPKEAGPLGATSIPLRASGRLIVEDRRAFANEALQLGISLDGGIGGEVAILSGLVTGTRLSVGSALGANGWRLPARDLMQAVAYAPKDFVGVMEGAVDVRTDNDVLVDSRPIRLAWLPKQSAGPGREARLDGKDPVQPAATPSLDAEELATLMRRGEEFLKTGDIAAARLVLRRAANAGHAQAALALGATYDPLELAELGVLGFPPDLVQARSWYEKAAQLGSNEGGRRIERLARTGN